MPTTPDAEGTRFDVYDEGEAGEPGEPTVQIPQQRAADFDDRREQRFSEITGVPEPAPLPGRLNVGRLLRRCAGVQESLLAWVPTDRPRYTHLGGFVLLTAIIAIGSSTIALTIAFDQPWYVVAPAAVFWGVVIFNLDRWIASSPLPEEGLRRLVVFLPRLVLAVVFAVVIAEPVLLIVFKTAVTEQLGKIRAAEVASYKSLIEDCNPTDVSAVPKRSKADCKDVVLSQSNAIQTALTNKKDAQAAANTSAAELATADRALATATQQMTSECRGQSGSAYGDGPVCKRLSDVYNTALRERATVAGQNDRRKADLAKAGQAVVTAQGAADKARAGEITAMLTEYQKDRNEKGGLLERIEALNSVAAAHFALLVAVWAIRLLLIAVDSIPAIAKITSGTTTYDRLVKEESRLGEEKHKARALVVEDQAQNWVDESAEHEEIGRAERRRERDKAADALLLTAAQDRDRQAAQFLAVVGDDQPPFGGATYSVVSRVESAGVAPRPRRTPRRDKLGRKETGSDHDEVLGRSWEPMPTFNVVALGGPGSGKTTFLAQMYDVLRQPKAAHPFTLTLSDGGTRTHLENWAATIRAPGAEWPDSTTTTHLTRYEFTCRVDEDGVQKPILKIGYWDYSGEALLQKNLPGMDKLRHDLSEQIAAADALLIIVDGVLLRDAWEGNVAARELLEETLWKIEVYSEQTTCPAQVVVTKWDELEGTWSRAKAMEALGSLSPIRRMSSGRSYRSGRSYGAGGMRVIPVSVVGGQGSTQRLGDQPVRQGPARPVNIDVPFAGLLPDRLDQIYENRSGAAIEGQLRLARSRFRWTVARVLSTIAGTVLSVLPFGGIAGVLAKLGETALSQWLPSYIVNRGQLSSEQTREDRVLFKQAEEMRDSASRVGLARYKVMEAFSNRLIRFDTEYPPAERDDLDGPVFV